MIVPLYISESAPRAIRGGLTGIYQLYIATGTMLAFWVNYGSIQHLSGKASYSKSAPLLGTAILALTAVHSRAFGDASFACSVPHHIHCVLQRLAALLGQARPMGSCRKGSHDCPPAPA